MDKKQLLLGLVSMIDLNSLIKGAVEGKEKEELLKAAIDVKKLAIFLLDNVVEVALKNAVEKSENKIDDSLFALLYPRLEQELIALIDAKFN